MKPIQKYLSLTLNPFDVFIVIKPGFTKKSKEILGLFEDKGFTISKYIARRLDYDRAADLYKKHKKEEWYKDLCKYMSSDISIGYCLKYHGAGDPIKVTNKLKEDIRKTYGKDDMRNALHSSDSEKNVLREANIYFE